jgi:hypothetical protein
MFCPSNSKHKAANNGDKLDLDSKPQLLMPREQKKVQHRNYNSVTDSKPDKVHILIHFLVILVLKPLVTGVGGMGEGGNKTGPLTASKFAFATEKSSAITPCLDV